jgi:hypothetical protein
MTEQPIGSHFSRRAEELVGELNPRLLGGVRAMKSLNLAKKRVAR